MVSKYHAASARFAIRGKTGMTEKYTPDQVRDYWNEQVASHGDSVTASWSDEYAVELEICEISKYLNDGDTVVDLGCAVGYSTVRFAMDRKIAIRGLDYIPDMIKRAQARLASAAVPLQERVDFRVGDVMQLNEQPGHYDKVIVTRVIINLGEWPRQQQGLLACAQLVKPGGLLLLSEPTIQGWSRLNAFRREWGLSEIPIKPFNTYLDEQKVIETLSDSMDLMELVNFSSTYFVGTRVLKPLLIQALGADIDVTDPNMEWNRWCASLPAFGDYGTQKLFIFRKT